MEWVFVLLLLHRIGSCFFNTSCHILCAVRLNMKFYTIDHVCHPNPCANGGICYVKNGAPYCACQDGFVGDKCQSKFIIRFCSIDALKRLLLNCNFYYWFYHIVQVLLLCFNGKSFSCSFAKLKICSFSQRSNLNLDYLVYLKPLFTRLRQSWSAYPRQLLVETKFEWPMWSL